MDVDQQETWTSAVGHSEQRVNAEAGPSSQPIVPAVFLPPPGPSRRKPLFDSTQDLISRFQLLSSYDKHVRPYVHSVANGEGLPKPTPGATTSAQTPGGPIHAPTPGAVDKGKRREGSVGTPRTPFAATTPAAVDGGDGDDADEDGGKGEKKKKNNYKHLIKGIPGKHSMKKDDYLQTIMLVPPKQKIQISKFDLKTQREAFAVSLEGLKGWAVSALVAETAQAREDRKRRKELKKLAKAQSQAGVPHAAPAIPTSATAPSSVFPPSSSAPTPALAQSGAQRRPQTPASMGMGTPRPQGPGPGPPLPETGTRPGTPMARPGSADAPAKRGKKREHEEEGVIGAVGAGAGGGNGNSGVAMGLPVQKRAPGMGLPANGKPGLQRPAKKPRTDSTPHPLGLPGVPQQQPTPQGV